MVLTGSTVQHLDPALLDHGRPGVTDLGIHRLPGVVVPEHLHQVAPPDTTFPPPRSLGGRTMLPRTTVPLVGRRAELATLVEEATRSGRGVTTLVGPGGTGKTRLAVEVAEQIGVSFPGGVYFVALEAATTLDEAWAAIGAALDLPADARDEHGVRRAPGRAAHVPGAGQPRAAAGGGCRGRSPAWRRRRRGSSPPRGARPAWPASACTSSSHSTDSGVSADASDLFASFAELARPGFVVDADNRDAVARICRRLDGLPLAHRARRRAGRGSSHRRPWPSQLDDEPRPGVRRHRHDRPASATCTPWRDWSVDLLATAPAARCSRSSPSSWAASTSRLVAPVRRGRRRRPGDRDVLELVRRQPGPRLRRRAPARHPAGDDPAVRAGAARRVGPGGRGPRRPPRRTSSSWPAGCTPARGHDSRSAVVRRERANIEAALDWALRRHRAAWSGRRDHHRLGEAWHQVGERAFDYIAPHRRRRCPEASPLPRMDDLLGLPPPLGHRGRRAVTGRPPRRWARAAAGGRRPGSAGRALLAYGTPTSGMTRASAARTGGLARAQEAVAARAQVGEDWLTQHRPPRSLATDACSRRAGRPRRTPLARRARGRRPRLGDLHRLDMLTHASRPSSSPDEGAYAPRRGRWPSSAAPGPPSGSRSRGHVLAHAAHHLARLAARTTDPAPRPPLVGIALATCRGMGRMVSADDLDHQESRELRDGVQAAVTAHRRASGFDRLVQEAPSRGRPRRPSPGCSTCSTARRPPASPYDRRTDVVRRELHRIPRRRARLLRRPRDRQHQVVLGGPQGRLEGRGARRR